MPHPDLRRSTALAGVTALALALTGVTAVAHADTVPVPVPLEVAVSGPTTGQAGGTSDVSVVLFNTGSTTAGQLLLEPSLPAGTTVVGVGAAGTWTCVLEPLRCTLPEGLAGGASSDPLPVTLRFDDAVRGLQQIAFVVTQGFESGALRADRGVVGVAVSPAAPPTAPPEQTPPPAGPVEPPAAAPQAGPPPAAVSGPVAPPAPAPAPVARRVRPAPVPVEPSSDAPPAAPADPVSSAVVPAPAAPAGEPPAALPFADVEEQEPPSDADELASSVPLASASAGADGIYTALLALVFGVLLVTFVYLVGKVVAQRRVLS